ncbi:hypothetical protein PBI_THONKO_40 [Mycobacterium phage Thonko]|uniref:Minor tail protein gp31 C-terminal domain-containing protein n=1 Tax=Mycobacterium phage Thonko TaxID=2282910 RepID=A0A346FC87_9CAUD|nr:tail fiber protein [Mycobacterium phage Thonko]AXN53312.1 hypothetical protein PBI_THONKO_40 [Mycobacterium phage Thonko]
MAITQVGFDTSKPIGQRLDPDMQAEVKALSPTEVDDGDITEPKIAPDAVTRDKIAPGAVGKTELGQDAVEAPHLADGAVGTPALAANSVTAEKAGVGVVTITDANGNPVELTLTMMTQAAYDALDEPDPNFGYLLY